MGAPKKGWSRFGKKSEQTKHASSVGIIRTGAEGVSQLGQKPSTPAYRKISIGVGMSFE